jgi:hypothetical protein
MNRVTKERRSKQRLRHDELVDDMIKESIGGIFDKKKYQELAKLNKYLLRIRG